MHSLIWLMQLYLGNLQHLQHYSPHPNESQTWLNNLVFHYNFWRVHQMVLFYLNSTCSFIKHRQISTENDRCKSGFVLKRDSWRCSIYISCNQPDFSSSVYSEHELFWTGKVHFLKQGVKLLLFIINYTHFSTMQNRWSFVKAWAFRWIHILFILLKDNETLLCCLSFPLHAFSMRI